MFLLLAIFFVLVASQSLVHLVIFQLKKSKSLYSLDTEVMCHRDQMRDSQTSNFLPKTILHVWRLRVFCLFLKFALITPFLQQNPFENSKLIAFKKRKNPNKIYQNRIKVNIQEEKGSILIRCSISRDIIPFLNSICIFSLIDDESITQALCQHIPFQTPHTISVQLFQTHLSHLPKLRHLRTPKSRYTKVIGIAISQ